MELLSPITIYWDLPADRVADDLIRTTAGQVAACRPLMLWVTLRAWPPGEMVRLLLEELSDSPTALYLTAPVGEYLSAPAACPAVRLKELFLSIDSADELAPLKESLQRGMGRTVGLSVSVSRENWRDLPRFVMFCREAGVRRLALPMQRLYNGETPFFINRSEQDELSAALDAAGGIGNISLAIHDPFLWRAFNPGISFPQAGCQAANTMIAIAPDGRVYPCPSLPYLLGMVTARPLKEIIASPEKQNLRRTLLAAPSGCEVCPELMVCRGGCRGRGMVLHGSLDGVDDACR